MPRRPLSPDRLLAITLNAYASRALNDSRPVADVVNELVATADGRTDLLGAELGLLTGSWRAQPSHPRQLHLADAFEALGLPGFDEAAALGRQRTLHGGHNAEGFGRPGRSGGRD